MTLLQRSLAEEQQRLERMQAERETSARTAENALLSQKQQLEQAQKVPAHSASSCVSCVFVGLSLSLSAYEDGVACTSIAMSSCSGYL